MKEMVVVGGGIGGLAAALACHRAGYGATVLEQANAFSDIGAGIQLGPNAVRVLDQWGLGDALRTVAARPQGLVVLNAADGQVLGKMALGEAVTRRYGSDYLTLHRGDLHQLLLRAVQQAGLRLVLNTVVRRWSERADHVSVTCTDAAEYGAEGLLGCDGVWSPVRQLLLRDGRPRATGHLAYRTLIEPENLPAALAQDQVTVWLGADMHAVAYPVRGGALFNLVVIVEGEQPGDPENWNHQASGRAVAKRLASSHGVLQSAVDAAIEWKLWMLHSRPAVAGPQHMARGRVALLGDASHAMLPYMAQGAAMALEDAAQLGQSLQTAVQDGLNMPSALQHYAAARWARNARVQERSRRNGIIFHATGPLRWARNLAMAVGGERMLDSPWLYKH